MALEHSRTQLGAHFSEGARLLWLALESRRWSQGHLMQVTGAKQAHYWLYGDKRPGLDRALKLRDLLGIPLEAWGQAPTVEFTLPALRETALAATGTGG